MSSVPKTGPSLSVGVAAVSLVAVTVALTSVAPTVALSQMVNERAASAEPTTAARMMVRDAAGKVTVRATRLSAAIKFDGAIDDDIYRTTPPYTDFVQQEPNEGAPATERNRSDASRATCVATHRTSTTTIIWR